MKDIGMCHRGWHRKKKNISFSNRAVDNENGSLYQGVLKKKESRMAIFFL